MNRTPIVVVMRSKRGSVLVIPNAYRTKRAPTKELEELLTREGHETLPPVFKEELRQIIAFRKGKSGTPEQLARAWDKHQAQIAKAAKEAEQRQRAVGDEAKIAELQEQVRGLRNGNKQQRAVLEEWKASYYELRHKIETQRLPWNFDTEGGLAQQLEVYTVRFPDKKCAQCGSMFPAGRADTKTCSAKCRVALSRARRRPAPEPSKTPRRLTERSWYRLQRITEASRLAMRAVGERFGEQAKIDILKATKTDVADVASLKSLDYARIISACERKLGEKLPSRRQGGTAKMLKAFREKLGQTDEPDDIEHAIDVLRNRGKSEKWLKAFREGKFSRGSGRG